MPFKVVVVNLVSMEQKENNVTKVFIWPAKKGCKGHVAVQLLDGTYISWWPGLKPKLSAWNVVGRTNTSCDEDLRGKHFLIITGLDEASMEEFWNNFVFQEGLQWCLLVQNCATVVHRVLCEGHAFFRKYRRWIWTPRKVKLMVEKYRESCMAEAYGQHSKVKLQKVALTYWDAIKQEVMKDTY